MDDMQFRWLSPEEEQQLLDAVDNRETLRVYLTVLRRELEDEDYTHCLGERLAAMLLHERKKDEAMTRSVKQIDAKVFISDEAS